MIIHILDNREEKLISNASDSCINCMTKQKASGKIKCPHSGHPNRMGVKKNNDFSILYCNSSNINSTRVFNTELQLLSKLTSEIRDYKKIVETESKKKYTRLLHNLITYNAHIIQDLYNIIPNEALQKKGSDSVRIIENELSESKIEHATAILRILKNSTMMKSEFSVFEKLYNESPRLEMMRHEAHKVILAVFNSFWYELIQNGITIDIKKSNERFVIDYDSTSAALAHLIDNTVKYIAPNTDLTVNIERNKEGIMIIFDMLSMHIHEDEKKNIFDEGYSGRTPKSIGANGNGIGLFMIKRLLSLNNATIEIIAGEQKPYSINKILYSRNIFKLVFHDT